MLARLLLVIGLVGAVLVSGRFAAGVAAQGPKPQGAQAALGSGFTYQGQLKQNTSTFTGSCDFQFGLFDTQAGAAPLPLSAYQTASNVTVSKGLFTVLVNGGGEFGPNAFTGDARWLEILVRCPANRDPYQLLTPRQALTATPYAFFATSTGALLGRPLSTTVPGVGQVLKWDGAQWSPANDNVGAAGSFWSLTGNTVTNPSTNFLGTSDNVALSIGVNGSTALRILPDPDAPALIGGYSGNSVAGAYSGATIGGGGSPTFGGNVISGTNVSWSTIAGGVNNRVSGNAYNATISGGYFNIIRGTTDAGRAVIGGGYSNTAGGYASTVSGRGSNTASNIYSTVSGGYNNPASGYASTVGGGRDNTASGYASTVSGGLSNTASDQESIVAGGYLNQATLSRATVGGGSNNIASNYYTTIAGGVDNRASGDRSTVGGGTANLAGAASSFVGGGYRNVVSGTFGTVSGGLQNMASGSDSTVGGGNTNTASGDYSTVSGGTTNVANNPYATVSGGYSNTASGGVNGEATIGGGYGNTASGWASTIAGGHTNQSVYIADTVGGGSHNTADGTIGGGGAATVSGGYLNSASSNFATIGGGYSNTVSGGYSTVGGGQLNTSSGDYSTVSGGYTNTASGLFNTVNGGARNTASNVFSAVSGGARNTASNYASTVPGGYSNIAGGQYSFAAGRNAQALHDGAFVWADSTGTVISTTAPNQFIVRAAGGVTLYSDSTATIGAALLSGSSSWSVVSDRNAKANFSAVDGRQVLAHLASIPSETWNYKTQDASIRHLGPMAQDFHAAFGVGENDTTISTVDAQGVALAAIQGLYNVVQAQDAHIAQLESAKTDQQQQIADLQTRLSALERTPTASSAAPSGLSVEWLAIGVLVLLNGLQLTFVLVHLRR